ncbi:hypothetical protein F2Q69_00007162 [Brassica cretica]|uniref:Uncharacterized protein n=1 Tax=Brassica cretica TaxID=69181 RepID=A0A8S9P6R4_BRACR|nr:hypothetical protein F2Q69_00007162 [Brassica cretica]
MDVSDESTFKEQTPIPAAPLPKRFKDDKPVNVTWGESNPHLYNSGIKAAATDPATSGTSPDCVVPVASTTYEEGGEAVNPNVSNPKPLSPMIKESKCGTPARNDPKAVEAVEHSSASPVVDIGGRDFPMVDDPNITVQGRCMSSSTRSNKEKHLLFSEDPAHLEHTIRKDQRSTSLDAAAFTSTDSRTHPSTDTRPSSSTDIHRSTSNDSTPCASIDTQSRNMVVIVILRQDENGNL